MMLSSLLVALATPALPTPILTPTPTRAECAALDETTGKITRVDLENGVLVLSHGEDQTLRLKIDANTTYWKGEEKARKEDVLKVGNEVTVVHSEGAASKVQLPAN